MLGKMYKGQLDITSEGDNRNEEQGRENREKDDRVESEPKQVEWIVAR